MAATVQLRPSMRPSLTGSPLVRAVSAEERPGWKRIEVALASAAVVGVVAVLTSSWILALGYGDVLTQMRDASSTSARMAIEILGRMGLVLAEALQAIALSTLAGLLLVRCEIRPSSRDSAPFWARLAVAVRIVSLVVIGAMNWTNGWRSVFAAGTPRVLVVLAAVQLGALMVASVRPRKVTREPEIPPRPSIAGRHSTASFPSGRPSAF